MKEIFKLDMKLRFKEIKIDKISGAIQFILIISAIFLFLKYLSSLTSNSYAIKELCALFLAFMGFFKIRTDSITQREMDFMTFFPKFNKVQVRKYFMYKKATITYIFIIYMLFPTSVDISLCLAYLFICTCFWIRCFFMWQKAQRNQIYCTQLLEFHIILYLLHIYIYLM